MNDISNTNREHERRQDLRRETDRESEQLRDPERGEERKYDHRHGQQDRRESSKKKNDQRADDKERTAENPGDVLAHRFGERKRDEGLAREMNHVVIPSMSIDDRNHRSTKFRILTGGQDSPWPGRSVALEPRKFAALDLFIGVGERLNLNRGGLTVDGDHLVLVGRGRERARPVARRVRHVAPAAPAAAREAVAREAVAAVARVRRGRRRGLEALDPRRAEEERAHERGQPQRLDGLVLLAVPVAAVAVAAVAVAVAVAVVLVAAGWLSRMTSNCVPLAANPAGRTSSVMVVVHVVVVVVVLVQP